MKSKISKNLKNEVQLNAVPVVPEMAMGPVFIFRKYSFEAKDIDYRITDKTQEIEVFRSACNDTIKLLENTKQLSQKVYGDAFLEIFESQIALLDDTIFLNEIELMITKHERSATYAITKVFEEKHDHFLRSNSQYFRDRAFDLEDLKRKLLYSIFGIGNEYQLNIPSIIFADDLSPSDTIHFNRNLILGFVTDTGGRTSHAAIIAKSLHIPYVINDTNLSHIIKNDDFVIIDGHVGKIVINPVKSTINSYLKIQKKYENISLKLINESQLPTVTKDGVEINILANVEFLHELHEVETYGAGGIGLYRTEGMFLEKDILPTEDEQYEIYRKFSETMGDKPINLRTVDVGGDKLIKSQKYHEEHNPFLGWRAIRFCLDEPEIFKAQLRAILRANVNRNIKILIPMVSCIREIVETKKLLKSVKNRLKKQEIIHYPEIELGVMIETPSAAIMCDLLATEVDFLSFGTNDLTQYTLAVDRTNNKISRLFNDMHPAVLRLMRNAIMHSGKNENEISICGEMAGNPQSIALLLGIGLRTLSISPYLIPKIKKLIRMLSLTECEQLASSVLNCRTALEVIENAGLFFNQVTKGAEIFN